MRYRERENCSLRDVINGALADGSLYPSIRLILRPKIGAFTLEVNAGDNLRFDD